MKRRKFVQFGAVGTAAGLAGCVGPLPDPLGLTDEDENGDEDNGDEDNGLDMPDPDSIDTPEYAQFVPTESQNESDGIFGIHVNLEELSDKFVEPYDDPYDELEIEDSGVTLSTGNSLLSIEPTLVEGLEGHAGWDDLRHALHFTDEDFFDFQVDEYLIVENAFIMKSNISEDHITEEWGLSDNGDGTFGSDTETVAMHDDWLVLTFSNNDPTEYIDRFDGTNNITEDSEFAVFYDDLDNGDITTFGFGSDVVSKDRLGAGVENVVSVAEFNGDLQTVTHMELTSTLSEDIESEIGSNAESADISNRDHFIRAVAEW